MKSLEFIKAGLAEFFYPCIVSSLLELPSPSSLCSPYNRPMNPRDKVLRQGIWLHSESWFEAGGDGVLSWKQLEIHSPWTKTPRIAGQLREEAGPCTDLRFFVPEVRRLPLPHMCKKGSLEAKGESCQGMLYPDAFSVGSIYACAHMERSLDTPSMECEPGKSK